MKRILASLVCLGLLVVPASMAFAAEGLYVAPKFIYGYTQMNKTKMTMSGAASESMNWNKNDSAFGGALAIGYDFNKQARIPVRAELEYALFSEVSGKKTQDFEGVLGGDVSMRGKQKIQAQTLFVNAYYDFRNETPFTPYLGAGIGLAFLRSKGSGNIEHTLPFEDSFSIGSKTTTNFAWNIGTGVAYDVTNNIALDLGYRFAGLGKANTKSLTDDFNGIELSFQNKTKNVYMHQLALGVRFTF